MRCEKHSWCTARTQRPCLSNGAFQSHRTHFNPARVLSSKASTLQCLCCGSQQSARRLDDRKLSMRSKTVSDNYDLCYADTIPSPGLSRMYSFCGQRTPSIEFKQKQVACSLSESIEPAAFSAKRTV